MRVAMPPEASEVSRAPSPVVVRMYVLGGVCCVPVKPSSAPCYWSLNIMLFEWAEHAHSRKRFRKCWSGHAELGILAM